MKFHANSLLFRYTSHDIQNEIFTTLSTMMREQIIDEIKSAVYFSVLADETIKISLKQNKFLLFLDTSAKVRSVKVS